MQTEENTLFFSIFENQCTGKYQVCMWNQEISWIMGGQLEGSWRGELPTLPTCPRVS